LLLWIIKCCLNNPMQLTVTESDVPAPRLQVLLAGMNSLRTTTNNLRDELLLISKNVSVMANLTK
jgi:hypothetical protein